MENIKTFEEYNGFVDSFAHAGQAISHLFTPGTNIGIGAWVLAQLGVKYLGYKRNKRQFKNITSNSIHTSKSSWRIVYNGDIIELYHGANKQISIDKKTRKFQYYSDIYPVKLKISKKELEILSESIDFCKEVQDHIEDCMYDLTDEGYSYKISRMDFSKKCFTISIFMVDQKTPNYWREKDINMNNISNSLNSTIKMICSQYGVKVYNGQSSDTKMLNADEYTYYTRISDYQDGIITMKNRNHYLCDYDLKKCERVGRKLSGSEDRHSIISKKGLNNIRGLEINFTK